MAAKVLNIEVGDHLVKVCCSIKKGKNYQIQDSFLFQTPSQTVSDGQIVDPKALAERLRAELAEHGASDVKNVTFTLSSSKVASREVTLPPVKDNRLKSVVETNAQDYFPVDMSNYQVAYNLLERTGEPEPGCRVLVMAAPKPLLVGYMRLAEQADLILSAIDYCGNSQYQVLRGVPSTKVVMYVDVGLTHTMVTFMQNGLLLLQRSFSFGGHDLVTAALHAAGRPDEEYLSTLEQTSDENWLSSLLSEEDRTDCLSRLVGGIARSADFFKSGRVNETAEQVVLMGVCSQIAGLQRMVAEELGEETMLLTEVSGVEFVANSIEGVSAYISCIGSLVSPLDLLPEELRQRRRAGKGKAENDSLTSGIVICGLCIVVAVGLSIASVVGYLLAVNRQDKIQQRMSELSHVSETYNTYLEYQQFSDNFSVVNGYSETPNAELVDFLEEMERKMPSSIQLLSAVCGADGVTMNVTTPGMEEAAVVIDQMRTFESISNITVGTITESADDTGLTTASFTLTCGYAAAEAAAAEAAAAQAAAEQAAAGGTAETQNAAEPNAETPAAPAE